MTYSLGISTKDTIEIRIPISLALLEQKTVNTGIHDNGTLTFFSHQFQQKLKSLPLL